MVKNIDLNNYPEDIVSKQINEEAVCKYCGDKFIQRYPYEIY